MAVLPFSKTVAHSGEFSKRQSRFYELLSSQTKPLDFMVIFNIIRLPIMANCSLCFRLGRWGLSTALRSTQSWGRSQARCWTSCALAWWSNAQLWTITLPFMQQWSTFSVFSSMYGINVIWKICLCLCLSYCFITPLNQAIFFIRDVYEEVGIDRSKFKEWVRNYHTKELQILHVETGGAKFTKIWNIWL